MEYRDLYDEPIIGRITQGSIFNGAKSRCYPEVRSLYGIIISPRCDIEQRKAPQYYYLPVITMQDWIQVDFPPIYVAALEKDVKNGLKNVLKEFGESNTILDKFSPKEVERVIKKHQHQPKKKVKEKLDIWKAIDSYKHGGAFKDITSQDTSNVKKNIFDELITHKNPNFYFIEHKNEGGFLLRMREINRLTPEMMKKLSQGIDGQLSKNELEENDLRQLEEGEIFMPLYVVKSPFMEHIMQHFMQQFNKIGIEDVPGTFTDKFTDLLKK